MKEEVFDLYFDFFFNSKPKANWCDLEQWIGEGKRYEN
jgi:hypothetical protein